MQIDALLQKVQAMVDRSIPPAPTQRFRGIVTGLAPLTVRVDGSSVDMVATDLVGGLALGRHVRGTLLRDGGELLVEHAESASTATSTTAYTSQAGWSVTAFSITKRQGMVGFNTTFTRTGAAVPVPVDGNIAPNQLILNVIDGFRPLIGNTIGPYSVGPGVFGYINTVGDVRINSVAPGLTINTGDSFSMAGVWMGV